MTSPQQPHDRPHNREVEDEMICPPPAQGQPPRPATEPRRDGPGAKTTVIL